MAGHAPYETHALITAAAAAQVSWMTDVARATGGRVWREGTVLCVHHPLPRDELHLLFPARLEPDELERVLDWCATSGVGTVGCWSSGIGQDEHVRAVLEADGFEEGWQPHWMAATLPLRDVEADARVESATEVPEYDAYGRALLGLTRKRRRDRRTWHFLVRDRGQPAGAAWLHVPDSAPHVAGIFDLSAADPALGRALAATACAHAAELGCLQVALNATGDGERLYAALGFASLGRGRTWWRRLRA